MINYCNLNSSKINPLGMRNYTLLLLLFICSFVNAQNYTLNSVSVIELNDNWCGDVEEIYFFGCSGSPDVFVEIYDDSNALIYESIPTDNTANLSLTLNIGITNAPYTIHLYDYDAISPNDDLGVFTISPTDNGSLVLSNAGSSISVVISESFDGCTDPTATNYDPLAITDDGSCVFFECPDDFTPTNGEVFYAPEGSIVTESSIQLPTATENEMYSEYIQFYAPSVLEFDGTVITFNSATINSIGNLPSGLSYQCSPSTCTFVAEQNGCLGLSGTPLETGVFDLDITASVSVTYDGGILGDIAIDFDIPYYGGNTYLDLAGIDAETINSFIPSFSLVVQESNDVLGCTDPIANNYEPLANVDDGSCDYEVICEGLEVFVDLQTTAFAHEISWEILNSDSDSVFISSEYYNDNTSYSKELCLNADASYSLMMHDEFGDGWLGATIAVSMLCDGAMSTLVSTGLVSGSYQMESFYTSCSVVYGCIDESATNYNALANIDDGSCVFPVYGCTDTEAVNYNPLAEVDDASCNYFECSEDGISTEAGFYPPEGSAYNEDSSYVYLPDANTSVFYEEYLKFFAEDTMVLEGLEIGFVSAKILNIINMPQGLYYQTSSADSTFYPNNVGCVGLFGDAVNVGVYELSIEAEVTVEILGSPITFQLPYTGGVMLLDLVYSDGDYSSLNSFIPTFVIEVVEEVLVEEVYGCTTITANNFNVEATIDDASCVWSQTIILSEGWNLFSTYINPSQTDIVEMFASIIDSVVIVKNNAGMAYLPEWAFNGIGNLLFTEAYQVKTTHTVGLDIYGIPVQPEENPLLLTAGWNMISYLRTQAADASLVLNSITTTDNLVIAKNNDGSAYLPEWDFNGIGNMLTGSGYQLKIIEDQDLIYLSNDEEY